MHIPQDPQMVSLRVERLWNGEVCVDDRLWADVSVSARKDGLAVRVMAPVLHEQSVPEAPLGARLDGLWKHDVVELFLVGPGHQYLELELGAGGQYLLLGFDSIRHRSHTYEELELLVRYEKTADKTWASEVVLPWSVVPENMRAMNAFAYMAGQYLAYEPVPGKEPDFHQPDVYPVVSL